jgi:signal recognition particle subunit SRP19
LIKKDGYVLWPAYFDSKNSVSQGRRVAALKSVTRPTAEMIAETCRRLGFEAEVHGGAYPRAWHLKTGYVVVKPRQKMSKQSLIRLVGEELRKVGKT